MPSTFTWLDYSERDRRRALDVVDLFHESGTVDELGLGSIRDSFSELLFPGTSTVQTRACYFLLLPWLFLRMERLRVPSNKAAAWARNEELRLNERLLEGEDTSEVFGRRAGRDLKRLASGVYWGGLGSWGIKLFPGHLPAYFRSLDKFYRQERAVQEMPHDPEGRKAAPANWHPHLPEPPSGFPNEVSVQLRRPDAAYLCDRIQARHPGSLLALLVGRRNDEDLNTEWPWELAGREGISPAVREQLQHARLFAVGMHGAALLYNLMLAEMVRDERPGEGQKYDQLVEQYQNDLEQWAGEVEALGADFADWDLQGLWAIVRSQGRSLGLPSKAFVQHWLQEVEERGPRALVPDGSRARSLIRDRERQLKRGRARLAVRRHRELWSGGSGTSRLDFRWSGTKKLLKDIFDGLKRGGDDASDA